MYSQDPDSRSLHLKDKLFSYHIRLLQNSISVFHQKKALMPFDWKASQVQPALGTPWLSPYLALQKEAKDSQDRSDYQKRGMTDEPEGHSLLEIWQSGASTKFCH